MSFAQQAMIEELRNQDTSTDDPAVLAAGPLDHLLV